MLGVPRERIEIISPSYCPFSQRACQYWPFKTVQTRNPLAPILKAIIASAEFALETTIDSVAVSAYDIGTIEHEVANNYVRTALSGRGVEGYNRLDHVARHLAPALGNQGSCSDPYTLPEDPLYYHDPGQVLFAIEYTRDAMTAGLWREKCGAMETINRWSSAQLGHNAMQTCRETANNMTICEKTFKSALRSVTKDSSRDKHEEIGPVLVLGECADDDAMLTTLWQVLTQHFPNGDSVDLSLVRNFSPDPAFAGSRSMARTMWAAQGSERERHGVREL